LSEFPSLNWLIRRQLRGPAAKCTALASAWSSS